MRIVVLVVAATIPLCVQAGDFPPWVQVVGDAAAPPAGFGDSENTAVLASAVYDGRFRIATRNTATGCEVWSSVDGLVWEQASEDGFGGSVNDGIEALTAFDGDVYATLSSLGPCEVWRLPIVILTDSFESGTLGAWSR